MPCGKSVRAEVIELAVQLKDMFRERLPEILLFCVGISCDGVKLELTEKILQYRNALRGKKWYAFV